MTPTPPGPRRVLAVGGLHGLALTLLALHMYVRRLPPTLEPIPPPGSAEAAWWGLWPATYVPAPWFWVGCALVIATLVWGWWHLFHRSPSAIRIPWRAAVAVLLVIAFFAFPLAHTRWGDAYILSRGLAWPDPALRLTHSWQAPLDVWLHSRVWLAFGPRFGWTDATPVYRLLSPLAGALYLGVLLAWSRGVGHGWLLFGLGASLGLLQLFFGYIENYSFAAAGSLLFLWLGYRTLGGRGALWQPSLALAITNATHPSTVVLAPALLYLGVMLARRGTVPARRAVMEIAAPMLAVAAAMWLLMAAGGHGLAALLTTDRPGGGDGRWLVPLWATTTRWEAYTLFSWPHLRDLLNQMLLVAPVVLPALLWLLVVGNRDKHSSTSLIRHAEHSEASPSAVTFLAVAGLCHLALIAVWNPDYGGQRDWDLFSLAWIPVALWLAALAPRRLPSPALAAGFVPLIVLQALHTAAWVYQNTLPWSWP